MQITIADVELTVNYTIDWGYPATREEPGEPPHVDFLEVLHDEVDITALLSNGVLSEIEEACFADAEAAKREDFEPPEKY